MRRITSAVLCVATVLTLGACKKDASAPPATTAPSTTASSVQPEQEVPSAVWDAINNTVSQPNFHMTLTHKHTGESGITEVLYDLKVNDLLSEKITACGTVTTGEKIDRFSVNEGDYCLLKSDGSLMTGQLDSNYTPCSALAYCNNLFSLLNSNAVRMAKVEEKGESEVTFLLPDEEFFKVWGEPAYNGASLRLSLSPDGFCEEAFLSISLNGTSIEYGFRFEDFGTEQDITLIHTPSVTEAQWKQAFAVSSFENVTVLRYYDDRTKETPFITMITPAVSAKTLRTDTPDPSGAVTQLEGMAYYYQFGSQYFEMETGTNTAPDGTKTSHYRLYPTEKFKGDTPGSLAAHLEDTFGLADQFAAFTYDEASQTYQTSGENDQWRYQTSLTFNTGRLTSIVHTLIDKESGEVHTVNSYYFQSYGTTVVEIPQAS